MVSVLKTWIFNQRVAYHEHDGYVEHPVAVKNHEQYFASKPASELSIPKGIFQVNDIDDTIKLFNQQPDYQKWKASLTAEEKQTLRDYIDDLISVEGRNVSRLDSILKKAKLPITIQTYRGLRVASKDIAGKIIFSKNFQSTSAVLNVAKDYTKKRIAGKRGRVILKIIIPKGSKAIFIDGFGPVYKFFPQSNSAEILLPRNTKMKISQQAIGQIEDIPIYEAEIVNE